MQIIQYVMFYTVESIKNILEPYENSTQQI